MLVRAPPKRQVTSTAPDAVGEVPGTVEPVAEVPTDSAVDPVELAPALDEELLRWDLPLFVDPDLQARVRRDGYAVGPVVLDDADLTRLARLSNEVVAQVGATDGLFLTVGRIADPVIRRRVLMDTADVVLPRLRPFFTEDAELMGSALQIKPPSETSELNPHQDSSLVDERRWPSVYAWIPATDTDERNGGLFVLPGSHRFGNRQRTLNVPWQLLPYLELMRERGTSLEVPAGQVVFFDAATVHWSPPNRGDRLRVAVNSFVKPAAAPLMHFYKDDSTPDGAVEAFEIDLGFFHDEVIMERPGSRHRALGPWPQVRIGWDEPTFVGLCERAMALSSE